MRCLLVGAAPAPGRHGYYHDLIRAHTGPVIAVDGGCDLCHGAGRPPEVLVGDLDSCSARGIAFARSAGALIRTSPSEKDVTDLDIALAVAVEIGGASAIVTATWSSRLDHTLAATGSVLRAQGLTVDFTDPGMSGCVLDSTSRPTVRLDGPGALFSVLTVAPGVLVSCTAARYPLHRESLQPLSSRGISNVVEPDRAYVSVEGGRALVLSHAAGGVAAATIS